MELLYVWLSFGVIFIIVEMLTSAFYGMSLSIAAFILAIYVGITGENEITLTQGVIAVVVTILTAYFLPRVLTSNLPDVPQGIDRYIGERRKTKKIGDTYKVTLDGVDYIVEGKDIGTGNMVEIVAIRGGALQVKVVNP